MHFALVLLLLNLLNPSQMLLYVSAATLVLAGIAKLIMELKNVVQAFKALLEEFHIQRQLTPIPVKSNDIKPRKPKRDRRS